MGINYSKVLDNEYKMSCSLCSQKYEPNEYFIIVNHDWCDRCIAEFLEMVKK